MFRSRPPVPSLHVFTSWLPAADPGRLYRASWTFLVGTLIATSGCSAPQGLVGAQPQPSIAAPTGESILVKTAIAKTGLLRQPTSYKGLTQPLQEVILRSQADGKLLRLTVKAGDRVRRDQVLAQVDDSSLKSAVATAESELTVQQSQISRLRAQINQLKEESEQAQLRLRQAQAIIDRQERLAREGATNRQPLEQARTDAKAATQAVQSAQRQISQRQEEIAGAQGRITALRTTKVQAQERRSLAILNSPVSGYVLEQLSEVDAAVESGTELLKLGDFSSARVVVQMSEQQRGDLSVGNPAVVHLEALPNQKFSGTITRISAPDPTSGLISIETTVPNPTAKISNGMVATVDFEPIRIARVLIPVTALHVDLVQGQPAPKSASKRQESTQGVIYVVQGEGDRVGVSARQVVLGEQANGTIEILSGLKPGEKLVTHSQKPLKDGNSIRLTAQPKKT